MKPGHSFWPLNKLKDLHLKGKNSFLKTWMVSWKSSLENLGQILFYFLA